MVASIGVGAIVRKLHEDIGLEDFIELENLSHNANSHYSSLTANETELLRLVKQFRPSWRDKQGRQVLEGGEVGTNANLARHLRDNGISYVETEETLSNGSRADIIVNKTTVIECKPTLLSTDTLHKFHGEMRRAKQAGYDTYGVIYGDARDDLLNELREDVGSANVIVLGDKHFKYGD